MGGKGLNAEPVFCSMTAEEFILPSSWFMLMEFSEGHVILSLGRLGSVYRAEICPRVGEFRRFKQRIYVALLLFFLSLFSDLTPCAHLA